MSGALPPEKFLSFVAAVLLLYTPVKQLGRVGQLAMQGAASAERIFEVLDAESGVPDEGKEVLPPFARAIRFEEVRFAYGDAPGAGRGEPHPAQGRGGGAGGRLGERQEHARQPPAALLGSPGRAHHGGRRGPARRHARLACAPSSGLVTQETLLFDDTVRANIAYGRPDLAPEEVERAARMACAHDFIAELPQGYDTVVGERGVLLSGGQRQRLAIARAFLKDAPILVLDEATSALDAESEREVQRALDGLMGVGAPGGPRTTLVIAHRLSTIRHADRIVVLAGGRVLEAGRHEDLLQRGGEYARLYGLYAAGAERQAAAG